MMSSMRHAKPWLASAVLGSSAFAGWMTLTQDEPQRMFLEWPPRSSSILQCAGDEQLNNKKQQQQLLNPASLVSIASALHREELQTDTKVVRPDADAYVRMPTPDQSSAGTHVIFSQLLKLPDMILSYRVYRAPDSHLFLARLRAEEEEKQAEQAAAADTATEETPVINATKGANGTSGQPPNSSLLGSLSSSLFGSSGTGKAPSKPKLPPPSINVSALAEETLPVAVSEIQLGHKLDGHRGIVHGGILALLMDDSMGFAFFALGVPMAVTANLNINYRNPVPAGSTVHIETFLAARQERKLYLAARVISPDGRQVYCETTSLFIIPKGVYSRIKDKL